MEHPDRIAQGRSYESGRDHSEDGSCRGYRRRNHRLLFQRNDPARIERRGDRKSHRDVERQGRLDRRGLTPTAFLPLLSTCGPRLVMAPEPALDRVRRRAPSTAAVTSNDTDGVD